MCYKFIAKVQYCLLNKHKHCVEIEVISIVVNYDRCRKTLLPSSCDDCTTVFCLILSSGQGRSKEAIPIIEITVTGKLSFVEVNLVVLIYILYVLTYTLPIWLKLSRRELHDLEARISTFLFPVTVTSDFITVCSKTCACIIKFLTIKSFF